jgi:hypothetical protein
VTTFWVVMDGDHDSDWIVAAYPSEPLAREHLRRTGEGYVQSVEVLSAITVEDTSAQREVEYKARMAEQQERMRRQSEREALRPPKPLEPMVVGHAPRVPYQLESEPFDVEITFTKGE